MFSVDLLKGKSKKRIGENILFKLKAIKRTRGHNLRVEERRFCLKSRKGFFAVRAAKMWNSLPQKAVSAENLKRELDIFLDKRNIQGYIYS